MNWRRFFKDKHFRRWLIAALVFTAFEVSCGVVTAFYDKPPLGIPVGIFTIAAGLAGAGAFISRLMVQKELDDEE